MGRQNQRSGNSAGIGAQERQGGKNRLNAAKKEVMRDGEIDEAVGGNSGEEAGKSERSAPILYTAREAAAFCMISESNWYKLNRRGNVPKPVRIGTMYRWRKSDLVDWVAAGCPRDWENVE